MSVEDTANSVNPWADSPDEREAVTENVSSGGMKIVNLKVPEGDTRVRIRGHYKFYYEHWFNKVKRTAVCPGKDCPVCNHPDKQKYLDQANALRKAGKEEEAKELFRRTFSTFSPRLKYAVNVLDRRDGQIKIWRFSRTIKEDIMKFGDINGDPNGYDVVITRKGTGKNDTEYKVTPTLATKFPLTSEEESLKLFPLATILKPTSVEKINVYLSGKLPERRVATPTAEINDLMGGPVPTVDPVDVELPDLGDNLEV